jgi:squalene-hopene cyclase-like protein
MSSPHIDHRPTRIAAPAGDFGDLVYEQMRNAPWVGLSVAAHGALFGILLIWPWDTSNAEQQKQAIAVEIPEDVQTLQEDDPPEVNDKDPVEEVDREETEVDVKAPEVVKPVPDPDPFDNDAFTPGESNAPLGGPGDNPTIGVGGGAGGGPAGFGGQRSIRGKGDSSRTEEAVDLALEWLKNHQSPDGRWGCDNFSSQCKLNTCDDPGEAAYTPGVSGLALLAFLGHGETHQAGPYKETVKRGLKYLKSVQDSEGCFGPKTSRHFQYNHACAALAMTEAYGMTGSRLFKQSAQRGVDFVHASQNPYLAWRYGVKDGDNDTSVTGWMTMVLKSGKMADLLVDGTAFKGATAWVDRMTEQEFGRVGYQQRGGQSARLAGVEEQFPRDRTEAMTAVGVLTRIFSGQDPGKNEMIRKGADLMAKKGPVWDLDSGQIDMYYWYYGTLAMYQVGGPHWKSWRRGMETAIVGSQRRETGRDERGSWDAAGPWGAEGGRVYSTALMAMCLEVYYRYGRVFGTR